MTDRQLPYIIHTFDIGKAGEEGFRLLVMVEQPGDPVKLIFGKSEYELPPRLAKALAGALGSAADRTIIGGNWAKRRAQDSQKSGVSEAPSGAASAMTATDNRLCGND